MSNPYRVPGSVAKPYTFGDSLQETATAKRERVADEARRHVDDAMPRVRDYLRSLAAEGAMVVKLSVVLAEVLPDKPGVAEPLVEALDKENVWIDTFYDGYRYLRWDKRRK